MKQIISLIPVNGELIRIEHLQSKNLKSGFHLTSFLYYLQMKIVS